MNAPVRRLSLFLVAAVLLSGGAFPLLAEEGWEPVGPPGGGTTHLVMHPGDPRILWAGTSGAGIFKSADGGASWVPARQGLTSLYTRALAVSPSRPQVLYAAAGVSLTLEGVFRSVDGGLTWERRLACDVQPLPCCGCVPLAHLAALVVHPREPRVVYAATGRGLFKSVDGGAQWRRTGRGFRTYELVFDPRDPEVLYAGGDDGVVKSTDGGTTWATWNAGMGRQPISEIVIDPSNPRRIWAGGASGVYRSVDGGVRWQRTVAGLWNQSVLTLKLAPRASWLGGRPALWAGTVDGLFRSVDAGLTWTFASPELQNRTIHELVAHPRHPSTLWIAATSFYSGAGAGEGILKSTDGGATWRFASRGLRAVRVEALAFDPVTPGTVWAGSYSSGIWRSPDRGATWEERNINLENSVNTMIDDVAIDPRDPETVWLGTFGGVHVSVAGLSFWQMRNEGLTTPFSGYTAPVRDLRIAPSNPSVVYASTPSGLYRTRDEGMHWTHLENFALTDVDDLLIDPQDEDVVFAAASDLWVSRDGGSTWANAPVWNGPTVVRSLAADPRDPDLIYAGGDDGVFRSADGGITWQQVASFPVVGVSELAAGPDGEIWAVSAHGIYRSPDGLAGWVPVPGLENTTVAEIVVDPHDPDGVYAATTAGVFRHHDGDGR